MAAYGDGSVDGARKAWEQSLAACENPWALRNLAMLYKSCLLYTSGRYDDAKTYALQMQELFGRDHYYIELMDHGIPEEKTVLPRLVRVAQETGIPMVATNDCHYLNRED